MTEDKHAPSGQGSKRLWAPWRIEYIRSIGDEECFICDRVEGENTADDDLVIARGNTCLLLLNAYPYNSGHVLVAPYRHVADITDLSDEEMSEMMRMVVRMKTVQDHLMHPDGFNFGFNLGAAAGAGLRDHIHGHLVPRWVGDTNFMPVIGDTRVVPEALKDTARMLREGWNGDEESG